MFQPTPKQLEANLLLGGPKQHVLLDGGSRSGKTFIGVRHMVTRARIAPQSRHCMLRFRLGHIKASVVMDTFPTVMRVCFPDLTYDLNKSELYATLPNKSEIWFGGLDDKERVEKILGNEYSTLYFNECSQIPWMSRNMAMTRLAQRAIIKIEGERERSLPLKAIYDCNPPDKGHWIYRLFHIHQDPDSRSAITDPENYGFLKMNPRDNLQNLSPDYIKTLESLPARLRKRFLEGEYRDATPNALFWEELFDTNRVEGDVPDMVRVVVAIDPSGADDDDNIENDEIGIVVAGLGVDQKAYVFEDCTIKGGPKTWGAVAVNAFERHEADVIVAEVNYGGGMVKHVVRSAKSNVPFKEVHASRGKTVRAEPISSLVEQGSVKFVGRFSQLEDELCSFTTHGFIGERSPNRADAFVWALSELFPHLMQSREEKRREALQAAKPVPRKLNTSRHSIGRF